MNLKLDSKPSMKCVCGSQAKLQYEDIPTLWNDKFINVKNCPVYICDICGEGLVPDSHEIGQRAKLADGIGLNEIEFEA